MTAETIESNAGRQVQATVETQQRLKVEPIDSLQDLRRYLLYPFGKSFFKQLEQSWLRLCLSYNSGAISPAHVLVGIEPGLRLVEESK